MTPDERQKLKRILDAHDAAVAAFHESSHAFDGAVAGMRAALDGLAAVNQAQGRALDAVIAANRAALDLLNTDGAA
jgi:hypothetical protein